MTLAVARSNRAPERDRMTAKTSPAEPDRIGFVLQKHVLGQRPEGKPVRLELHHLVNGRVGDLVDSAVIRQELGMDDVHGLAMNIYEVAVMDAAGYKHSSQRYILQIFGETEPATNPVGRCVFEVSAGREQVHDYVDTEANEQNVAQMLMRYLERREGQIDELVGSVSTSVAALMAVMRSAIQDRDEENRALRNERREDLQAVEQARSEQWKRQIEERKLAAELAVKHELVDGLKLIGSGIARRVGLIDPRAPIPADEAPMLAILSSITAEQWDSLMGPQSPLSQTQKVALSEYMVFHLERQQKAAEQTQAQTQAQPQTQPASAPPAAAPPAASAPAETPPATDGKVT